MIYKWKASAHHPAGLAAQAAGEELERIRTWNNGRLAPADVVAASKDKGAPLRDCFEWNDKKAAAAHRINQAGDLIRSVEVIVEKADENERSRTTRAFVSVVREEDRSYTSIAHALSETELRAQVVETALSELAAFRKKYAELAELAEVFAAIDKARGAN